MPRSSPSKHSGPVKPSPMKRASPVKSSSPVKRASPRKINKAIIKGNDQPIQSKTSFIIHCRLGPPGQWASLSVRSLKSLSEKGAFLDDEVVGWTFW
jgi:hypothetical protein